MNINVYLENELGQALHEQVIFLHKSRNAIIREAIQEWVERHQTREWPSIILNFKGMPNAPRFESYRKELKKVKDDPFE